MAEILHQLRLVVFPMIYRVSAPSQVVVWDFSHQQYNQVRQIINSSGFALECLRIVVASATLDSFYKNAVKVEGLMDEGMAVEVNREPHPLQGHVFHPTPETWICIMGFIMKRTTIWVRIFFWSLVPSKSQE